MALFCALTMLLGLLTACGGDAQTGDAGETTEDAEGAAEDGEVETRYLTMSAVASSSGLFPYCVAIGDVLSNLPELEITVAESGGNVANTQELRIGEISIANSMSNTDYESYTGTGSTFDGDPFTDIRILWYYESSPIQVFVAEDTDRGFPCLIVSGFSANTS